MSYSLREEVLTFNMSRENWCLTLSPLKALG